MNNITTKHLINKIMFIFKGKEDDSIISKVITILAGLALVGDQVVLAGILLIIASISAIIYDL